MTCTSLLAHQLSVRFGSGRVARQVLDGVSIAFQTGSVTLLKGPSGSGKTTLLSVLGGLLRPHEGRVELQGADLYAGGDRVAAGRRRHFGFVFQAAQLFPTLRVIENVRMPLDLLAIDRTTANARARSLLASVGLSDRCDARPRELSGGEQQRVAIARALAADPDVLLADEPTAALDAMGGLDIAVILRRAASEFGKTVVIVSHDDRLTPAADRIVGLVDGRIVSDEKRGSR